MTATGGLMQSRHVLAFNMRADLTSSTFVQSQLQSILDLSAEVCFLLRRVQAGSRSTLGNACLFSIRCGAVHLFITAPKVPLVVFPSSSLSVKGLLSDEDWISTNESPSCPKDSNITKQDRKRDIAPDCVSGVVQGGWLNQKVFVFFS